MAAKLYRSLKMPDDDAKAIEKSIERCEQMGLGTYSGIPEFIRDAVRRRIEEVNAQWRASQAPMKRQ